MKSLSELLQILLDNVDEYYFKTNFLGLCHVSNFLERKDIIQNKEKCLLSNYLIREAKTSEYYKITHVALLFEGEDLESRIKWLKEHIKLTT